MDSKQQKTLEALTAAIEKVYTQPKRMMWRSFLMGLLSGLGATLGVAIVLTLLGYLIHAVGGLPVVGDWLTNVQRYLPGNR